MSKYIKLEDAIEQIRTVFYKDEYQEWLAIAVDNLINRTADLPTIDIVRCKECKYWRTDEKVRCRLLPYADDDDFCSYGERKDNE